MLSIVYSNLYQTPFVMTGFHQLCCLKMLAMMMVEIGQCIGRLVLD